MCESQHQLYRVISWEKKKIQKQAKESGVTSQEATACDSK